MPSRVQLLIDNLKARKAYSNSSASLAVKTRLNALSNPVAESTKQCCRAYKKFTADYPMYTVDVKLCAFSPREMADAQKEFIKYFN